MLVQVKQSVKELPLCWYGVKLLPKNLLDCAISLGLAIKDHDEPQYYRWGDTFYNLRDDFEADSGVHFELRVAWGGPTSILGFFSNWEIESITPTKLMFINNLLELMNYPPECELLWYPDVHETVSVVIGMASALVLIPLS